MFAPQATVPTDAFLRHILFLFLISLAWFYLLINLSKYVWNSIVYAAIIPETKKSNETFTGFIFDVKVKVFVGDCG